MARRSLRRRRRCSDVAAVVFCGCVCLPMAAAQERSPARDPGDAMFAESEAYERFMGRWSQKLAPLLLAFAEVRAGDAVLDVGSGTGSLASAAVTAFPTVRVTGIDTSAAFVAYATTHVGADRLRFSVGDAQALEFADATFDRVLSLLVVNFIPDRGKAVAEMIRVTRPGGIVAAAVWDYGGDMQMLRMFWDEAVALSPAAEARDERHMPLCRPGELTALWRTHRLEQVTEAPIEIAMRFVSFHDYWSAFLGGQGPAGAYVASLRADDRARLEAHLRRRVLGGRSDGPFTLRGRAWAVRGTRSQP